jgi:hypothetical protein
MPRRPAAIGLVLGLTLLGVAPALPAAAAGLTLNVTTTADTDPASGPCQSGATAPPNPSSLSLRDATCIANNAGGTATISVPAGTYQLSHGELQIGTKAGQDVTLAGAGAGSTTIDAQGQSRVLDFDPKILGGVTGDVQGVTITGGNDSQYGGAGIIAGSGSKSPVDALTVDSSVITGNHANTAAPAATNKPGGGIQFIGGQLTITNSTISNNSAGSSVGAAVRYEAQGTASPQSFTMSNSKISGNTGANNTSSSLPIDGAVALAAPSSSTSMTVSRSAFTGNAMTGTSGPVRGAALTLQGGAMTVTGSSFSGNSVSGSGSAGGAIAVTADTASATITSDRIAGNQATSGATVTGIYNLGGSVQATDDWWGCNAGPGNAGCDTVSSGVTTTPNLVLSGPAQAVTVTPTGTAPITADVDHDSTGQAVGPEYGLDGDAATFSDPQPSGTSCTPGSVTFSGGTASATCTYAANGQAGSGHVVVTVDGQSITVPVTISGPPTISTQPQDTTVAPGATATFTAAATGAPAPTVQWQVSTDGGTSYQNITGATSTTYSFTAAAADSGNKYRAVFTNTNGSATTDPATLTVQQAPAITSADHTTFTAGTAGTFTITTTGTPDATVSESGTLPTGVTFTAGANGTATLSGTPAAGTGGSYPVTLTAHNGVSPDATQNFTLTINEAPAITSADSTSFGSGATGTFTVTTSGNPHPSLSETGDLPSGVTFTDNGDGTATLKGSTTASGTYHLSITASSSAGTANQAFTLTIDTAAQTITFTSSPPAGAVVGQDYTVTATGGGSGNPVTFTIDDTSSGVCTISGSTVTFNHPGACLIDAAQDGSTRYAPATASQTVPVSQAATTTTVTIHPSTVSAAVTVDSPGAGTPTGTVAFSVNGQPVGTASVSGGVATLNYRVPKGKNQNVAAVYSGDSDFSGSSGSTSRQYLGITATVSSSTPKTSYDWYRSPVTITFHCTTGKAPLTSPCPSPVTLSQNGAGQSVTRTIFATNGKVASVTVRNINIDTIAPQVSVDNVKNGATYHGTAPTPACHGRDTLSGIASCRLATSTAGDTVTVTATATDFAGNVSTATVSYTVVAAHRVTAP